MSWLLKGHATRGTDPLSSNGSPFATETMIRVSGNGKAVASLPWSWALHAPSCRARCEHQITSRRWTGKAEFEASWKQRKASAGMEEVG
jgi:hypothetical protein